jgi:hypothetical protein
MITQSSRLSVDTGKHEGEAKDDRKVSPPSKDDRRLSNRKESNMKTTLTLVTCASLVLPFAAFGQSADAKYCEALSTKYREVSSFQSDSPEAVAMAKCKAGDTASGIPVLEKALKNAKVPLPPRT